MDKHLHIVCFDVPLPADYGGVIDVFYRIKALHEMGIKIHLHCFEYGRGKQPELDKYCVEVNYYGRKTGLKGFSFKLPYIVKSRADKKLLQNLLKDDHPILLEGIHCTYFLFTDQLKERKIFVRLHNVEFEYYTQLAKNETSFLKRLYFKHESGLLRTYEKNITGRAFLLAITQNDVETYKVLNADNIKYLPVFLPHPVVTIKEGVGNYCLFHGNLSVVDNEKAAIWLCEKVFAQLDIPFVIAGKNPSGKLQKLVEQYKNISLINDPVEEKLNELITNAQVNVLPSFNASGIKIKLLNSLFHGRHCVVNNATVKGTGLETLCTIATNGEEFKSAIRQLFAKPLTREEMRNRIQLLKEFDNKTNTALFMQWIY